VLKSMFGPKKRYETREWKSLRCNEHENLYSRNIITKFNMIKGHDVGTAYSAHGKMSTAYKLSSNNLNGRDYLEELDVDTRIILKCILEK
jgi:hypothetical protein